MSKLLKIVGRITGGLLEWILILIILFAFAIRTSPVQTFIAGQVTDYLSKELKTTFHIDKVDIVFFNKVALDGVLVLDLKKDTIASIQTAFVTLKSFSQTKNLVALKEVNLKGGVIKISREKETGAYNYWFIQDYFATDKPKTAKKPMTVTLDNIRLSRVNFHYDDYRKDYSAFGMDYDHLKFKNIYLFAEGLSTKNGISAFIKHISFREKGGFELNKFSTAVNISEEGLKLKRLHIVTPYSQLYLPKMNMLMNEMADFQSFEDSVTFDARIDESNISLKDISYFGTALEGMTQNIILEADVSNQIKNLKIANLKMRTGNKTRIEGTINLPDFREFDQAFFQEKLSYVYIDLKDLQGIKLPKDNKNQYMSLGKIVNRLDYFKAIDLKIDGFYSQFVVEADKISTALGSVRLDHGIMFSENKKNSSFLFEESQASDYDVKIDSFQLGKFLDEPLLGSIHGTFFLNGEIFGDGNINFHKINGELTRVDFMDYPYRNIHVTEASFKDNIFDGLVVVEDENLQMTYDGFLDLNKQQHFDFDVSIDKAQLNNLKIIKGDTTLITLRTTFSADISGTGINNYSGYIGLNSLLYQSGNKSFDIPRMDIQIDRSVENDHLSLRSKILNADVDGKIDFNTIADDFNNQFSVIFPALLTYKEPEKSKIQNHFTYNITVQEVNALLNVFVPDLEVRPGTTVTGSYEGSMNEFSMTLNSPFIRYENIRGTGIQLAQTFKNSTLRADYKLATFSLNDTLAVHQVTFVTTTDSVERLHSVLRWNPETANESLFTWNTDVKGISSYQFELLPSYFNVNEHRWDIEKAANISFTPKDIHIDQFMMRRENQYISLNGALSTDSSENLKVKINDFQLDDFSSLIGSSAGLKGVVNGEVTMTNPFENLGFLGEATVTNLYVNNQEVGNVNLTGKWDKVKKSIALNGDLHYKNEKTFNFDGDYYLEREDNNINFELNFDRTNIAFVGAFLNPEVVSNVKGLVEGKMRISGTLKEPVLEGSVSMLGGNAKIAMFGVNFGFNGNILIDKNKITIDNMPLIDEEGNTGELRGTVSHANFKDWQFKLMINLETYYDKDLRREVRVDNFLVMNTTYEEGSVYYGKAYATGNASISGYADNLDISVNMRTERNTKINFPMYGVTEIKDELSFEWESHDTTMATDPKIDLTGVNLDLNFDVTPDAEIKLIFDDQTGDEITARGRGQIGIKLDSDNQLSMDGRFTVTGGSYHFVLGTLKEDFILQPGGTITWNGGGAEDAYLDIKTTSQVTANVNELIQDLESQRSSSANQVVNCNLTLTGSLSDPQIAFNIEAPKASESVKTTIAGINNDKDELNKQFFSLLLFNKFQPMAGVSGAGYGNAAFDAVTGQINALLGELSKDVRLRVDINDQGELGGTSGKFGFETSVLNDKLIIKGSLGVENNAGGSNQSNIIGDINLEYILDDNGNFKVTIFNESNDYSVIQDKNLGQFTQGVGLQYQEEFQSYRDFKLLQSVLDWFRKDKRIKYTRKRRQVPVPTGKTTPDALPPEETPQPKVEPQE